MTWSTAALSLLSGLLVAVLRVLVVQTAANPLKLEAAVGRTCTTV